MAYDIIQIITNGIYLKKIENWKLLKGNLEKNHKSIFYIKINWRETRFLFHKSNQIKLNQIKPNQTKSNQTKPN